MFGLSPWLQLPIVLAVAVPLASVAAWAMLRVADWLAYLRNRARERQLPTKQAREVD
ncbi:hypothetical protein [Corynebacterium sp. p3-SID1056]|uniref:hypothetical protein n=1 Tax=Corynebacterium sp. p3-SID1056 TaxID=2916092 RepID=UPI0021A6EAE2|nr:hypothetical protein [Corynebacterium sp. p3-SID1056]MCT2339176.1 hypothetical protein [Corynebacterium sp. p3-SID1056]